MASARRVLGPRSFTGRLLLVHVAAVLGVLLVLGVVVDRVLERNLVDQLTDSLVAEARTVQEALSGEPEDSLQQEVLRLGVPAGARITIVRSDGVVLADTEHDPATMQNHRDRPEVRRALAGEVGTSTRTSATIGVAFRYVALPPRDDRIVRLALPLTTVEDKVLTIRLILGVGFGLAALVGVVTLVVISRGVTRPLRELVEGVERIRHGEMERAMPQRGSWEIALLGETLNRMQDEIAARMQSIERDRGVRDAILSAMEDGILLFDQAGATLYQNPQAETFLGRLEGTRGLASSHLRGIVSDAAGGGRPEPVEVGAGPVSRTLRATAVGVPDGAVMLVLRDVTLARAIDAVRRDFVANASHELKTPAASIRALAETLVSAAHDDPEAVPRFAEQLDREAIRLSRLVSDLLDLSRLEGEEVDLAEVRLDQLVREETERLRTSAEQAQVQLAVAAGDPVRVRGSARDLGLLIRNLVENAIQYSRPGGRVEVVVEGDSGDATLVVRDTGIGIPARDLGRVFERFYRVDRARSRETGGTGLGLSIVKHVAENHDGTVHVESQLGGGSTFIVRIPRSA